MVILSSICEINTTAVLKLQKLISLLFALLYNLLNLLIPGSVICAGVNELLTQADIETQLWDTLATGSDIDDASDEDVIKDPSWNMKPL
jgi:hypothetical protein